MSAEPGNTGVEHDGMTGGAAQPTSAGPIAGSAPTMAPTPHRPEAAHAGPTPGHPTHVQPAPGPAGTYQVPSNYDGFNQHASAPVAQKTPPNVPIIIGCLVAIVALMIGGWFVSSKFISQNTGVRHQSTAVPQLPNLPTDPQQRYSFTLDPAQGVEKSQAFGTPDRLAVNLIGYRSSELILYDRDGQQQWTYAFDDAADVTPIGSNFLAVAVRNSDSQVTLLDGDKGEQVWSVDVGISARVFVFDNEIYVVDGGQIDVYSVSTGENLRSARFDRIGENAQVELEGGGGFLVYDSGEVFAVGSDLKPITKPIPSGTTIAWYLDKQIVVSEAGQLIRYDADGKQLAADRFESTFDLTAIDSANWFYNNLQGCGVIDFSGDKIDVLWQRDDCETFRFASAGTWIHQIGDVTYVLTSNAAFELALLDARNGDEVRSSKFGLQLFANGLLQAGETDTAGYSLPAERELFTARTRGDGYLAMLRVFDGGYVLIEDDSSGEYRMSVYY